MKKAKFSYSLRGFASWLRTKPPGRTYMYGSPSSCAAAQFHRAIRQPYYVGNPSVRLSPLKMKPVDAIEKVASKASRGDFLTTFGATIKIAERAIQTDSWR